MGIIKSPKFNSIRQGKSIKSFMGCVSVDTANFLNLPFGQLTVNYDMEYFFSGNSVYLKTRRGTRLIYDTVNRSNGAGNYIYDSINQFLIWSNSSGQLFALNDLISTNTLLTTLTENQQNVFQMYGQESIASLYGCNEVDGIYKVSGITPTYSSISLLPTTWICFSNISGRMIGVYKHLVRWTEVQGSKVDLTNLETWSDDNSQVVSPDSGTGFKCCVDDGEMTYLFKDTGIWALPNASGNPRDDWFFPKLKSTTGTKSPKTVHLVKYGNQMGVCFLGADKTLRFLRATVQRNAGTLPSIVGGDSVIISRNFQNILNKIPSGSLNKCVGNYTNGKYILCVVDENGVELSRTLTIDMEKLIPRNPGDDIDQPFFFETSNLVLSDIVTRDSTGVAYGFHINGYVVSLFQDNIFTDSVPSRIDSTGTITIPWQWNLSYQRFLDREAELIQLAFSWRSEGLWPIKLMASSFTLGRGDIPNVNLGTEVTYYPPKGKSYFDVSLFDVDVFSESGQLTQTTPINVFGDYFSFGAKHASKEGFATFYGLDTFFKILRNSPVSHFS